MEKDTKIIILVIISAVLLSVMVWVAFKYYSEQREVPLIKERKEFIVTPESAVPGKDGEIIEIKKLEIKKFSPEEEIQMNIKYNTPLGVPPAQ